MSEFSCTVVIASRNRPEPLGRLLGGLAAQVTDARFEVIVILDDVTDATRNVALAWEENAGAFASFRWYEQSRKGVAAARNRGAFLAQAPVLLFLDDDVIPEPDLIAVHIRHHETADRIAVLGDCGLVPTNPDSLCELSLWTQWEDMFHRRSAPGQPSGFRDFYSANVSLRTEDFARIGGFDPDFAECGREDYEIGHRLLTSGVRFVADRAARAQRHKIVTVRDALRAKRDEAHGDVLLARKYPELIRGLSLMSAGDKRARRAAGLAMFLPWIGTLIFFARAALLWIPERLRLRGRWQAKFAVLQTYAYWRGLRDSIGSMAALHALRATAMPPMTQQLDASRPLAPQVERLNIDVPSRLLVLFKDEIVGSLELHPSNPEPLLPWIVQEISGRMASTLLLDVARDVLLQHVEEPRGDAQLIETA